MNDNKSIASQSQQLIKTIAVKVSLSGYVNIKEAVWLYTVLRIPYDM